MPEKLQPYKIIFNEFKWSDPNYKCDTPSWAICSAPTKKRTVTQRTGFHSCRESFQETFGRKIEEGNTIKIPVKRTRLLSYIVAGLDVDVSGAYADYFNDMKRGVKAVNVLEKEHGWRSTKLHKIQHDKIDKVLMVMTVGDSKWMRSPQMLSMYILIMRTARHVKFDGVKSTKTLIKAAESYVRSELDDYTYIKNSYKYWDKILKHFDDIFKGLSLIKNYDSKGTYNGGSAYNEGIQSLIDGFSNHKVLYERFKKYCKEDRK